MAGCDSSYVRPSHRPLLPALPAHWEQLLGQPEWRFEWINVEGRYCAWEGSAEGPGLSLMAEWTTPVLAWPFWPAWDLRPGMMHPAGALYPWDAAGNELRLSWLGGVEACFWNELADADRNTAAAERRLPWYFDWTRFRELLGSEDIPETVRLDPWIADWKEIGRKTVQSGFDRRRIVQRKLSELEIPEMEGLWISSSPFMTPVDAPGPLCIKVSDTVDTWVSANGILKCSIAGWVLRPR